MDGETIPPRHLEGRHKLYYVFLLGALQQRYQYPHLYGEEPWAEM